MEETALPSVQCVGLPWRSRVCNVYLPVEAFESGIQPKVFGIPLTTGTRNKLSRNPESCTWSPKSTAWNPDSKTVTK